MKVILKIIFVVLIFLMITVVFVLLMAIAGSHTIPNTTIMSFFTWFIILIVLAIIALYLMKRI
ncbi:MAG: hypothetical protein ACQUYJ_11535, partial [Ferruginibacter sp.]